MNNPDSTTTKVHVLNVTPDASKTEDFTDSSDDDIPTINTGKRRSIYSMATGELASLGSKQCFTLADDISA